VSRCCPNPPPAHKKRIPNAAKQTIKLGGRTSKSQV
jgi:hypothetical protein